MSLTTEQVAQRFEECAWVFDRLPNQVRMGFSNCWPEIKLTPRELSRQEAEPIRLRPLPDAIDRAEETLSWIQWIKPEHRNLVWLRAHKFSWREIARRTGFPKTTAERHWQNTLAEVGRVLPGFAKLDG